MSAIYSAEEISDIQRLAGIMRSLNRSACRDVQPLDTRTLERATMIKEWGRMSRMGLGLGYGLNTFNDGVTDPPMPVEKYEQVSQVIAQLPSQMQCVLIHLYQLSEKPVAAWTAQRLGTTRGAVEELRDGGLNVIYGATCVRITMADKKC